MTTLILLAFGTFVIQAIKNASIKNKVEVILR